MGFRPRVPLLPPARTVPATPRLPPSYRSCPRHRARPRGPVPPSHALCQPVHLTGNPGATGKAGPPATPVSLGSLHQSRRRFPMAPTLAQSGPRATPPSQARAPAHSHPPYITFYPVPHLSPTSTCAERSTSPPPPAEAQHPDSMESVCPWAPSCVPGGTPTPRQVPASAHSCPGSPHWPPNENRPRRRLANTAPTLVTRHAPAQKEFVFLDRRPPRPSRTATRHAG
jgi:hypothetical protein